MWRDFWITSSERQIKTWVHDVPEQIGLENEIAGLDVVERVESQHVIYADYTIKEQESDSEGQLIPLAKGEKRYRFFYENLSGYREKIPEFAPGEIYVSPSMVSMFGFQRGDEIHFAIARSGGIFSFQVKGFYEDPFMGSSISVRLSFPRRWADFFHGNQDRQQKRHQAEFIPQNTF